MHSKQIQKCSLETLIYSEYQFYSRQYMFNKFKFKILDAKILITIFQIYLEILLDTLTK